MFVTMTIVVKTDIDPSSFDDLDDLRAFVTQDEVERYSVDRGVGPAAALLGVTPLPRASVIFDAALSQLSGSHEELEDLEIVTYLLRNVEIPDTGDDRTDRETTASRIEALLPTARREVGAH